MNAEITLTCVAEKLTAEEFLVHYYAGIALPVLLDKLVQPAWTPVEEGVDLAAKLAHALAINMVVMSKPKGETK